MRLQKQGNGRRGRAGEEIEFVGVQAAPAVAVEHAVHIED